MPERVAPPKPPDSLYSLTAGNLAQPSVGTLDAYAFSFVMPVSSMGSGWAPRAGCGPGATGGQAVVERTSECIEHMPDPSGKVCPLQQY
jgi:hypothetical protein